MLDRYISFNSSIPKILGLTPNIKSLLITAGLFLIKKILQSDFPVGSELKDKRKDCIMNKIINIKYKIKQNKKNIDKKKATKGSFFKLKIINYYSSLITQTLKLVETSG